MDAAHFDSLARSLTDPRSRRGAVAAALGGALGLVGLTQTDARKHKACSPCKKRKNGNCRGKLPDGSSCRGGSCLNGVCVATPPPSRECVGKLDNTRCGTTGHCLRGVCNPRPKCGEDGTLMEDGDCRGCCSGECYAPEDFGGLSFVCNMAYSGQVCYSSVECRDGRACIGNRCSDSVLVCPTESPYVCYSHPSVEGCVPQECSTLCQDPCNPQNENPCGGCEPYLACDFEPSDPELGYRCTPQLPLRTCPLAAPALCALGPLAGCVPAVCKDAGRCWARCNPQNENPCGGCEPYLVCDFDPANQEDGYRCRPQVPPTTMGR